MISKLPRWVELGAFLLALLAGCVNAIGLMGFQHQAITHVSGTITLLANHLFDDPIESLHLIFIVLSFLMGSAFSGFFIQNSALKLGRRYGISLCIESALFLISLYFLLQGSIYGQYIASIACGLQNGMVTTFSGAVVRTTHMTGIITDLGLMLGARLRGDYFDHRKARLFILILCGFITGGVIGASLFSQFQFYSMLFPSGFALFIALLYWHYLALHKSINILKH